MTANAPASLLAEAAELAAESGSAGLEVAALHDRVRLGDPSEVAARLQELVGRVDGALAAARADHAAALLADDPDGLVAVAERFAAIGATVLAAEAAGHAGAACRRAGQGRKADRLAQWQRTLAEEAGGVATPAMGLGGAAAALTRRELQIARLAAAGRANREIAEALVVSLRTVENHLHRAYEKLGVTGREELREVLEPGA